MRLILDEHLSARYIGEPLRGDGHDVLALAEATDHRALPDDQVIELTADENRILVTCDGPDFTVLARAWAEEERIHAGIVIVWSLSNNEFGPIVAGLRQLLDRLPQQDAWRGVVLGL